MFSNVYNVAETLFLKSKMLFLKYTTHERRGGRGDLCWYGSGFRPPSASPGP